MSPTEATLGVTHRGDPDYCPPRRPLTLPTNTDPDVANRGDP